MTEQELMHGLINHLILSGATLNAENPAEPVVLRPMKADVLLPLILDYLIGAGYASPTKISQN